MKTFYSHLVKIDFLHEELDSLDLTYDEKEELLQHVHSSIHYVVLDIALTALPEEHKKTFVDYLKNEKHLGAMAHLLLHTESIEDKIKNTTMNLVQEFLKEVKKVKKEKKLDR